MLLSIADNALWSQRARPRYLIITSKALSFFQPINILLRFVITCVNTKAAYFPIMYKPCKSTSYGNGN